LTGNPADAIRIAACMARRSPDGSGPRFDARHAPQSPSWHDEAVEPYRRAMTIAPSFFNLRSSLD